MLPSPKQQERRYQMTNYLPARLTLLRESDPLEEDDRDYNPEQEQRDEEELFEIKFSNDLYEREEGIS